MAEKKLLSHYPILALVLIIIFLFYFAHSIKNPDHPANSEIIALNENSGEKISPFCVTKMEEKTVRGNSMTGLIEPNEIVKLYFGYYDYNEVKRNDVVAYDYAGEPVPIIKIVRAVPGDSFQVNKTEKAWNIIVNGEILKNSKNNPYVLDEKRIKMISLYENSYNGIVPENVYLIMGNIETGSVDSTRFGLVGKKDIIAKVEFD